MENNDLSHTNIETSGIENSANSEVKQSLKEMEDTSMELDEFPTAQISPIINSQSSQSAPKFSQVQFMEEISNQMGDYFNSLKNIESGASNIADLFYKNAALIVSNNEKLTKEQENEVLISISIAVATMGLTYILTTIKMTVELQAVIKILQKKADKKLDDLLKSVKMQEDVCDIAYSRFIESKGFEQKVENFNTYRQSQYFLDCAKFLIATYEAALRNEFQSEIPFPSYYQIDSSIFYKQLTNTVKTSSDEARMKVKGETVIDVATKTAEAIAGNTIPDSAGVLLGVDEAVTAMAVLDTTPTINNINTEDIDETEILSFVGNGTPLFKLLVIRECAENSSTEFANAVKSNSVLNALNTHIVNLGATYKQYNTLETLHGINTLLFAALMFCISLFSWDFAWYWSLAIGVVGFFIANWMAPWKSLKEKYIDKIAMITSCIRYEAQQAAGKSNVKLLSEINVSTKKRIYLIILGGIIGLVGGPIGFVIGLIVGASLAGVFDDKEREIQVEDYNNFSIGSKFTPITIMIVLVALIAMIIYAGVNN